MFRPLFMLVGLLEILVPRSIVAWGERLAFDNPGVGRLRSWTVPIARIEGIVFVLYAHRGRRVPPMLKRILLVLGFTLALAPRTVLDWSLRSCYENSEQLEVKPWVVPATRVFGILYLVIGLFPRRVDTPEHG